MTCLGTAGLILLRINILSAGFKAVDSGGRKLTH